MNASFFPVLNSVALVLKEFDKTVVDVAGHTDSTGSDKNNQELSRAAGQCGRGLPGTRSVSAERLITVGFGERPANCEQ